MLKKPFMIFISLFSFFLFSQDVSILDLDLDSAIDYALMQNYDLKKETLNLSDKKMTYYDSWTVLSPTANASFSISKKLDTGVNQVSSSMSTGNPVFGISISQPVEVKMVFALLQNYYDYKEGKINFEKYKKTLVNDITKNYFLLVLMREELRLKKQSLNNAKERYDQSLIQFRDGEISELDRMNRELSYKILIPDYSKAENGFNYSLDQFKILIGIDTGRNINLTTMIPEIDYASKINGFFGNTPDNNFDYELIYNRINRDKNTRNMYISQLMPAFAFAYNFTDAFQKDPFANNWGSADDWKISNSISFSISLKLDNFFPLSALQLNIVKARNSVKRDELDLEKQAERNKVELKSIRSRMDQILAANENLKFNVNLSKRVYQFTLNEFKNGSKNLNDVKDAETAMIDANLRLLGGQYDMIGLICDLEMLLNVEFKDKEKQ